MRMLLDLTKDIQACREETSKCNTAMMQQRILALETKKNWIENPSAKSWSELNCSRSKD